MRIDGYTRLCGLIGNPVEHTMSPAIHNTIAESLHHNLIYSAFHVEPEKLEDAVKGFYALNGLGCNVTVPYKSDVIPFLVEIDPLAKKIGAVNTLVRKGDGFKGYNTDMPGLYRAMQEDGIAIKDEHVLILGAGGVARAVAMMAASYEAGSITILNRTIQKAIAIKEEIEALFEGIDIQVLALSDFAKLAYEDYIVIQATNVGMFPNTKEAVIEDPLFYQKVKAGYDLVYRPSKTKFMSLVEAGGSKAYNGLKMLLYQGVIAYELWNDCVVDAKTIKQAYEKMKEAMGIYE